MKGNLLFLLIIIVAIGCDDNLPTNCVVKEAIIRNGIQTRGKVVFTHDGTNYTEAKEYLFDPITNQFELAPVNNAVYTYYDDGRIANVKYYNVNPANFYEEHRFTYADGHITSVEERLYTPRNGDIRLAAVYRFHYIESPADSAYRFGDITEEYNNGNLVRYGTGTSTFLYKYDNSPNVVSDYVFRSIIPVPNFGYTRNNVIEESYAVAPTNPKKQSFSFFGNGQLNQWIYYDTNRVVSFIYDCR